MYPQNVRAKTKKGSSEEASSNLLHWGIHPINILHLQGATKELGGNVDPHLSAWITKKAVPRIRHLAFRTTNRLLV